MHNFHIKFHTYRANTQIIAMSLAYFLLALRKESRVKYVSMLGPHEAIFSSCFEELFPELRGRVLDQSVRHI